MRKIVKYIYKGVLISALTFSVLSCETQLEEIVYDEIATTNFFQNDQDAILAVNAIYAKMRNELSGGVSGWGMFSGGTWSIWVWQEAQTDEFYCTWGGDHWGSLDEFVPRVSGWVELESVFTDLYQGISLANNVLENIDNENISEEIQNRVKGEAYFGRALFYYHAFSLWGSIPIIDKFNPDPKYYPLQASKEEIVSFIVSDLKKAEELLPLATEYASTDYGRFTKGAARALLARFYLNQFMWQEAADKALDVIESDVYSIVSDYGSVFTPDNEGNKEIILTLPCNPQLGLGNTFLSHTTPGDFSGVSGWDGYRIRQSFYDTFDLDDIRRSYCATTYTSSGGETKDVLNGALILKYGVDPGAAGEWASNDIVIQRYADVILTRAEALNEIEGPNQTSIDLINQIRTRAFPSDNQKPVQLSDFGSKEELRDYILLERGWELHAEGYRRDDLIRHGKYISQAIERGANAEDYQVLYPIPQVELDRNPNLVQNDGY